MPTVQINRRSSFIIGKGDNDYAVYIIDRADYPGDTPEERILAEARARAARPGVSRPRPYDPRRPERNLDIAEQYGSGVCRYLFQLDPGLEGRLVFVRDRPFIALPMNSTGDPQTFMANRRVDRLGQWASFDCDLDKVRSSKLAGRIRELNSGVVGHGPPDILNIPFTFNVVDPKFKASPWVVPGHPVPEKDNGHGHSDGHRDDHHGDRRHSPPFTHGGVHPTTVAFLGVDVTERA